VRRLSGRSILAMLILGGLVLTACGRSAAVATTTTSAPAAAQRPAQGVQVWMKPKAMTAEIAKMRIRLSRTPEVASCSYLDHRQSYAYGEKLFKAKGELAAFALKPATTPTVFFCRVQPAVNARSVAKLFRGLPGVFVVQTLTLPPMPS
jgi:cell division protein FtsX